MKKQVHSLFIIIPILLIITVSVGLFFNWYNKYGMKYLVVSWRDIIIYILVAILSVAFYLLTFSVKKTYAKSIKFLTRAAFFSLSLLCMLNESFVLSTWVHKSQTNDINNYLQIDCQELRKEKYFSFLPLAINEQAQNIVYDYQWRVTNFAGSGAYVYFSCILPETEYDQEKRRIEDISTENNILLSKIGKSQVYYSPYDYSVLNERYNVFEVTFNDAQHMVSYFCAMNCFWNCDWQILDYTNQDMSTNQRTIL